MNDLVENYRLGDLVYGRDVFRKCYMKNLNSNIFCIIDQYNDVIADGLYGSEQTNTALGNTGLYKPIPNNMYLAALIADDNKYETLFSIIKSDFLKIAKHGSIASLIHISDDVSLSKVFLNSYIDLLLNDERKKFDLSTILKKIKDSFNKMGIKSVSDAVEHCSECSDVIYNILLKRLCRLGIEWCLINDKKLHFFIPNPNDTASWVSIIEKHPFKDPLGVIKVPFTTYELLFLLKRFERYKNTVIFYDEKNGKEIHQEKILPLTKQIKINKPESLCLYNKETEVYSEVNHFIYEYNCKYHYQTSYLDNIFHTPTAPKKLIKEIKNLYLNAFLAMRNFMDLIEKKGYQTLYDKKLKDQLIHHLCELKKLLDKYNASKNTVSNN